MIYQWVVVCDQFPDSQDTLASDHLLIDAIILVTGGLAEYLVLRGWQKLPSWKFKLALSSYPDKKGKAENIH